MDRLVFRGNPAAISCEVPRMCRFFSKLRGDPSDNEIGSMFWGAEQIASGSFLF